MILTFRICANSTKNSVWFVSIRSLNFSIFQCTYSDTNITPFFVQQLTEAWSKPQSGWFALDWIIHLYNNHYEVVESRLMIQASSDPTTLQANLLVIST